MSSLLSRALYFGAFMFAYRDEMPCRYLELANRVDEALGFMQAAGLTMDHPVMQTTEFWTSHECLLLPYEQSLTRLDSTSGLYYDCSAHFLWVGERTRQLGGSHVEFLRGIANPLGIKVVISFVIGIFRFPTIVGFPYPVFCNFLMECFVLFFR